MNSSEEAKRFRKTAADHLRKSRKAKSPEDRQLQEHLADGYKKLAESDELLENERGKNAGKEKKKPRGK